MNSPEPNPDEEEIAALLASNSAEAPAADPVFLAALRESSTATFQAAVIPTTPRNRTVKFPSFRWIAAIAAMLVVGVVFAQWRVWKNRVIAPNDDPTPDEKFVLSDKLTDDGRIGKVTDVQGVVGIKPVLAERWSPAPAHLVLKPGDWLRTDSRGANAASLKLLPTTTVIVGPHSTVELTKSNEIHLVAGEIEVTAAADAPIELLGPDQQSMKIDGRQFVRIEKGKLVRIEKDPLWLQGFKGTSTAESLGSLIASVDGRNVPLTVGYHHVTIDIRDQIARTVIEESFVNRTDGVLEGVFHFPLPADASISGFGMWIGDKLVEADVVEKQRAREIYETILREKHDPGLLEWAGGNIFKARVYPIPARSEKRIKISYTQVLPLKGNKYRYGYALQSELLKQHPLRDLKIDVKIQSAVEIKSVTSPTHDTRLAKTEHSGHVEFAAQEYTPTRDFEAVVELGARPADVVVLPHQRGGDGYFLVQLAPPGGAGVWDRPLIPNGDPLKLLLLADTSASMDRTQRATQNAILASLLGALTPKDSINVAACDVNCDWLFEKPVPATAENIAIIRETLAKRVSLGWTNLDKAFASAIAKCETGTHAIYLGDGISTSGDADPVAFAKRLAKLHEGKPGTFHAIALGSGFEPAAMKAIAALGGGSLRRVSGEQGPQTIVAELLTEIATPALRNLKVEFTGVRTARVYPEELPNIAAGSQQILLGRYLPEGKDQQGEIVVTGTLGGKPVRYVSKFSLKDAEQGNSFLPRLWARMHLDKLLEQGSAPVIRDEIIALSEEFNIITPYTSLLVLETDTDRERFAVKRRFQMRDGERFFADGRETANFELKQKQMRLASDHRTALRRTVLAQLRGMGRNARLFDEQREWLQAAASSSLPGISDNVISLEGDSKSSIQPFGYEFERPAGGTSDVIKEVQDIVPNNEWTRSSRGVPIDSADSGFDYSIQDKLGVRNDREAFMLAGINDAEDEGFDREDKLTKNLKSLVHSDEGLAADFDESPVFFSRFAIQDGEVLGRSKFFKTPGGYRSAVLPWLTDLFPQLPAPARERKEAKSNWPAPALALSRGLLRSDKLAPAKGGLAHARQVQYFEPDSGALTSQSRRTALVSTASWSIRSIPDRGPVRVLWCDARELGSIQTAYQLGRTRVSNTFDVQQPPLDMGDESMSPLHRQYADCTPTVEAIDKDRTLLILKRPSDPLLEIRYVVDTARRVLLCSERRWKGKVTSTVRFSDFAEVAGSWWARKIETFDAAEKRTSLETTTVAEISAEEFAARMAKELVAKEPVLFLKQPLPKVSEAKAAVVAGKAGFDDRAVLVLHFAASQQWAKAREHAAECERLAGNRAGMRWLTRALELGSRRHEELGKSLTVAGAALGTGTDAESKANAHFSAHAIFDQAQQVLSARELLALSVVLEKVVRDQPPHLHALKKWRTQRVVLLQNAGEPERALDLSKALATEHPGDAYLQYQHAQNLSRTEDYEAAYAWLDKALVRKWNEAQAGLLRGAYSGLLQNQGRVREQADYLAKWVESNPATSSPYGDYLYALVRSRRGAKADELVNRWLREGRIEGELPEPTAARMYAAVEFARGQGRHFSDNRVDERWHAALAETALHFAHREDPARIAETILQNGYFANTDAGRAARKTLGQELLKGIATLPTERIARYAAWADQALETDEWATIAAALRRRWAAEKTPDAKHALGQSLIGVLHRFIGDDDLNFLREQWKSATELYRSQYANSFFNALIVRPWKSESEDELFALLAQLAPADEPAGGLRSRIRNLHRLTDEMVAERERAAFNLVEHPEKLARVDLAKKRAELLKQAREGFADRLKREAAKHEKPFAAWVTLERLWLEVQLERDFKSIAADAWSILDAVAPVIDADDDASRILGAFDAALRDRALMTLTNLAARKGADAELVARLSKFIDVQLAAKTDEPRWRAEKYRLLIALDRIPELEADLRRWIAAPGADPSWRLVLGRLLAEQGKVAEAIPIFEAAEAVDELGPEGYRNLADWYRIENRREQSEKARTALYQSTDEQTLYRRLNGYSTVKIEPEVLEIFRAIFEKSAAPQIALGSLQRFYGASRDFRLLAALADGIVGHSAGTIYAFLQSMGGLLSEIRDEATADELVQRIVAVRARSKTAVDLRALDLLELRVERRAAELQNQPGPHAERALTALVRAFKREWSDGERRLMAGYLRDLGNVASPALAQEQHRQLEVLHRDADRGTFDRLQIALLRALALSDSSKLQPALDVLEAALREFEAAHAGKLPTSANEALGQYVNLVEGAGQFERGVKTLLAQLGHPVHTQQKFWLIRKLNELYRRAVDDGGDVSLGRGEALYKALEKKLFVDLATPDQNQRYALLQQLVRVYRTAHAKKFAGVPAALKASAFEKLAPILNEQTIGVQDIELEVAGAVRDLIGPREGIAFLLDRIEADGDTPRSTGRQPWFQYADRFGSWRIEAKDLGDLEPRYLKFVLAELRRDLRLRESSGRPNYDRRRVYYWPEKEAEFAAVVEEILAERKATAESVEYIAEYFFYGLPREKRAIEILLAAYAQKRLTGPGEAQLVDYLHRTGRFAESIPPLQQFLERYPESTYRTQLMHAYYKTGKMPELLALLKSTDAFFHEKDRWGEWGLATLAASTLENRLFAQSVAYYEELLPRYKIDHPGRGAGDGVLHRYYLGAADAYAGLGRTKDAIDRASAAVVLWPAGHRERAEILEHLVRILQNAPKLDETIAALDAEALQSAVVRKALGQALIRKNEHARAIPQLKLAAELQPNDTEVVDLLVVCFDKIGDKEGAVRQLFDAVELSRREIKFFAELGRRLAELQRPAEAERANTSTVELSPNESEGHAMLAEIREKQNRWAEAIAHWERVAQIRALEPTGLLKLAEAQIHEKSWIKAGESLRKLRNQKWPEQFKEVARQTRDLEKRLEEGSRK